MARFHLFAQNHSPWHRERPFFVVDRSGKEIPARVSVQRHAETGNLLLSFDAITNPGESPWHQDWREWIYMAPPKEGGRQESIMSWRTLIRALSANPLEFDGSDGTRQTLPGFERSELIRGFRKGLEE